jgi:uncharacterized protein involved in exopolysaccharide biosynthesis
MPEQDKAQQTKQVQEDEIDLRDYINVIIKKKKLILGIFLASVIFTAIISFLMPKIYDISMLIEPSVLGVTDGGSILYLDSPENIKAKIENKVFELKIIKGLDLYPKINALNLKVSQPADSSLIKVNVEKQAKDIKLGIKILNQLFVELSNVYGSVVESKKNNMEKQISIISNNIETKNNGINLAQQQLKLLDEREPGLLDEITNTKSNMDKLLSKRDILLDKTTQADDMSSLLYSNTIQQNIAYFNRLQNELTNLRVQKESIKTNIENLENDISNIKIEIEKLNLSKDNIHNIGMVQEPQSSLSPVRPNKKLNVALAGIISLMFGVFLAFFVEFWQKQNPVIARSAEGATKQS